MSVFRLSGAGVDRAKLPTDEPGERSLEDEAASLRRLILETRSDLAVSRDQPREANRARFAESLAALGELAIVTDQADAFVSSACALVASALDVDGVALFQESGTPGILRVRFASGCVVESHGQVLEAGAGSQLGFALSQRGSTATADARAAWMEDPFLRGHAVQAAAVSLLPGSGGPRVLLGAYQRRRRAFTADEVRFLEAAGGAVAAALSRCQVELERKELHARLALADRMASVGTMAAGVAHELNNPLSYVSSNLTFLAEQVAVLTSHLPAAALRDPAVREVIEQVGEAARDARDGVERMRAIVGDLRQLSRADDQQVGPVELGPVAEACVGVAWNEIKRRARLVKDLQRVPSVRANQARVAQIVLNLLLNAAQSIPSGRVDRNEIRLTTRPLDEERVVIEVADTGGGIDPEVLPRIFEPFFTTKPAGEGIGLGLSIVQGIVRGMHGEIEVESELGQGTTFRVILPVCREEPAEAGEAGPGAAAAPDAAAPAEAARRAAILVVDDEPLVGAVLQRTLGYEHDVTVCGGGPEALARLARGERYDLVFSDLLMPEMSGFELLDLLRARHPDLARHLVFLTGGVADGALGAKLERSGVETVEKPFELEAIRAVIARHQAEGAATGTGTGAAG